MSDARSQVLGRIRQSLGREALTTDAARALAERLDAPSPNLVPARAQLAPARQVDLFVEMAEEAAATVRAAGGTPDDRCMGDLQGAILHLRSMLTNNGKVGIIGYCSGGRQTYLSACSLSGLDAAVDCYGGRVIPDPEQVNPRQPVPPIDLTANLSCPLLGLFGAEDLSPSPDEVARTEEVLKQHGKTYEFHTYQDAGHSFFSVDRPAYRQEAATEGWQRVFEWYGKYLSA